MSSSRVRAGNIYVNRNQIGAVVGSQPFGGEGLSGTGPKAGGPHYLPRFSRPLDVDRACRPPSTCCPACRSALPSRRSTRCASSTSKHATAALRQTMPGPTGESNVLETSSARHRALPRARTKRRPRRQAQLALAHGNGVLVVAPGAAAHRRTSSARTARSSAASTGASRRLPSRPASTVDAVMHFGDARSAEAVAAGARAPRRSDRAADRQRSRCRPADHRAPRLHRYDRVGRQCGAARPVHPAPDASQLSAFRQLEANPARSSVRGCAL